MDERNAPVFVKVEDYKDVMDIITVLKDKIAETENTISQINKLKNEEDSEIELWEKNLSDIKTKLEFIDGLMFEPKV